jgi:hypothetical protein
MSNYNYSDKPNLKGNAEVTRVAAAEGIVLQKTTETYFHFYIGSSSCFWSDFIRFYRAEQEAEMLMKPIPFR